MQAHAEIDVKDFVSKLQTPESTNIILHTVAAALGKFIGGVAADPVTLTPPGSESCTPGAIVLKTPDGSLIDYCYSRSSGVVFPSNREKHKAFLELVKSRKTPAEIIAATGIPKTTVYRWLQNMQVRDGAA